jgi:AraC-like DNA-binding protein
LELLSIHSALLLVSLFVLLLQLFVRQKRTVHIVFAIFCGSIAMFAAKQLGDEQMGVYRFVIGMGACATCNGFWLVARALFRESNAISGKHILAAGGLGLLLIAGQGLGLIQSMAQDELVTLQQGRIALYEVINLFSSCMLVLAAWEGCRGLSKAYGQQLWQRLLFLGSYCSAVLVCTVLVKFAGSPDASAELSKALSTICAIQIIIVTQVLIYWRFHRKPESEKYIEQNQFDDSISTKMACIEKTNIIDNEGDQVLAKQIQQMLEQQNMYLQANLKVADLARQMSVSEYRISRIFRHHFNARNFNQFINEMRIKHAKILLQDPVNAQWPILVVGLESGFASVGPFTRAFKSICDMTPNQYRQFHQSRAEDTLASPLRA